MSSRSVVLLPAPLGPRNPVTRPGRTVKRGMSNKEIADRLVISVATAKARVARLFSKLDARDRVQLVIMAYETGLVTPPR